MTDGHRFAVEIMTYRTSDHSISGVVIPFTDALMAILRQVSGAAGRCSFGLPSTTLCRILTAGSHGFNATGAQEEDAGSADDEKTPPKRH